MSDTDERRQRLSMLDQAQQRIHELEELLRQERRQAEKLRGLEPMECGHARREWVDAPIGWCTFGHCRACRWAEKLRDTLAKYGDHVQGCAVFEPNRPTNPPKQCSCGWLEARAAIEEAGKGDKQV